jgi:hypothetical protein
MPNLLLVEALPQSERVSEVAVLAQALEVLRRGGDQRRARAVSVRSAYPRTKVEFLRAIRRPCDFLHISAHGRQDRDRTQIFLRGGGTLTPEDLTNTTLRASTVFVNACGALGDDLERAFITATHRAPAYYIAPRGDTWFDDALLVALLFYKAVLFDGKRPAVALHYPYRLRDLKADYRWVRG